MRRPLLIGLIAGGLAFVILVVVGVVLAVAAIDRGDALAAHGSARDVLQAAVATAEDAVAEADEVLPLAADPLLPAAELGAVGEARDATVDALATAAARLAIDPDALGTEEIREATGGLRDAADALDADDDAVDATLAALVRAAVDAAPAVESASFDANNAPRIAFRDAVGELDAAADDEVGESLAAYLDGAHALEASHAAELAEKAGPLFDARMAVQQFARSMSGGVLLEFDWAVTVNGYGTNGSYGGTSYWTTADGGQATVRLSDSVAAQWPGAGVQSLVVHEVGHAILSRADCNDLFFTSDLYAGEEESWATAWAIGLGYTADGSGESIYGRPSDALIALSQQCR